MPGLGLAVGFFTLCMICVFLLYNFAQAQTKMSELNVSTAIVADENAVLPLNNTILRIAPFPINIKVPAYTVIPPYGLQVTAVKNITNIKAQFSDLIPDGANSLWIPRNKITTNPETFNVTAGHLTDVDLLINAGNVTGSYHGTMTLSYPGGISQFQIILNVFEDLSLYIYTIIVLGLGVFTSFFVKLIRIQNDARQDALDTFNESRNEMVKANEEKRLSTEFDSGARKF